MTSAKFAIHEDKLAGLVTENYTYGANVKSSLSNRMIAPDQWIKEGDMIKLDPLTFTVIHTPGHTSGGICLYGESVLFSGDTLFNYGIGRTDFPGGDYNTLIYNIKSKLLKLPDETRVYPGHGTMTTIGDEKRGNPFLG